MALPSAQLGQMPTMQMPFYIPVTPYSREPKAWEKALINIITNTGANAVNTGVQNYMQPDYAENYPGMEANTGLTKFLRGPNVNRAENAARQETLARLASEIGLREIDAQPGARDVMQVREAELAAARQRIADMQKTRMQFGGEQSRLRSEEAVAGSKNATERAIADAVRKAAAPGEQAHVDYYTSLSRAVDAQEAERKALTERTGLSNQFMRDAAAKQAAKGASIGVSPNVANWANDPEAQVNQQNVVDSIKKRLLNTGVNAGPRDPSDPSTGYPTAEAILRQAAQSGASSAPRSVGPMQSPPPSSTPPSTDNNPFSQQLKTLNQPEPDLPPPDFGMPFTTAASQGTGVTGPTDPIKDLLYNAIVAAKRTQKAVPEWVNSFNFPLVAP